MKRYYVIANPTAGKGLCEKNIPKVKEELEKYQLDYQLVRTEKAWHAAELAKQAVSDGFDVVVAVGGDGTVNEVLNGLMEAQKDGLGEAALGVVPIGSGNDFSHGMRLPIEFKESCRVLAEGEVKRVDVGYVEGGLYPEGRYFGNGIGVGFDAIVGYLSNQSRLHGFLSYFVAVIKTIFLYYEAPVLRVELDDEVIEQASLMVSVMNGYRMGGGFIMTPDSIHDDGLFDLCVAGTLDRLRIFGLIPHFLKGTQGSHRVIDFKRSRKVKITAIEGTIPAQIDGELLCRNGDKLSIELLAAELLLLS